MEEKFGEVIKAARKQKGLTLRDLAKKVGMSHAYLSQLEQGHNTNPSIQILVNLSQVLDLSFAYLTQLVDTDVGLKTPLDEKIMRLFKDFKPSMMEDVNSFEDFVAKVTIPSTTEKPGRITEDQLRIAYDKVVYLSKIEERFKSIAKIEDIKKTLEYEDAVEAKNMIESFTGEAKTKVDLENVFNIAQEITINGKTLSDEEKQKALQILKITFGN